jgi:2-polyprenyl-6-methoxyphenol hydroxylase-like FAD-dependent oxidoreductase
MLFDAEIAGGGAVGSFLDCELQLAGVSVPVLERMEDPHSPWDNNHDQRVHFRLSQSSKIDIHWPSSLTQGLTIS